MSDTIAYYNANASRFFSETVGVEMSELHGRFASAVPDGGVKLNGGKAAPFIYEGPVHYQSHTGSAPMSVVLKLMG